MPCVYSTQSPPCRLEDATDAGAERDTIISTMSTLLRSPDASPSSFHYATSPTPHRPSSSRSAHVYSSPRRPFNVPVDTAALPIPVPSIRQGSSSTGTSTTGPVAGSAAYVDAGTQYSPDGYPPTAGPRHRLAPGAGKPPGVGCGPILRKRKGSVASSSELDSTSSVSPRTGTGTGQTGPMGGDGAGPDDGVVLTSVSASAPPSGTPALTSTSTSASAPAHPVLQEARSTHGHSAAPKRAKPEPGSLKVMPLQYETCNPKDLGVLIANMLMELIRINDQIPLRDGRLTRFHSRAPPGISVSDYLQRLIQHATLSPPIMLSMVFYIDKLCTDYPAFTINSLTVHRFLIAAATVAAKGLSDSFWTNPTYARIGGIPVSELATLELELLQRVDYRIVPKPETLEEYYASLVERADGYTLEESISSESESSLSNESEEQLHMEEEHANRGEDEDTVMADSPS